MSVLALGLAICWAGLYFHITLSVFMERLKWPFYLRLCWAWPIILANFGLNIYAGMAFGGGGVGGHVVSLFVALLLMPPAAFHLGLSVSNSTFEVMAKAISGSFGIVNLPSFDKAMAAERKEDFVEAERCYLEFLATMRAKKIPEEDLAEARLAYGNLLHRLGRPEAAAAEWEAAAAGNIMSERAQIAALRASDHFLATNQPGRARTLLEAALKRYPREPANQTLRLRLQRIPPPAGKTDM